MNRHSMVDPYLEINVNADMDALEITKTKAIQKYEENAFLLGQIFEFKDADASKERIKLDEEAEMKPNNDSNRKQVFTSNFDIYELYDDKNDEEGEDFEEKVQRALREFKRTDQMNDNLCKELVNKLENSYREYKNLEDIQIKKKNDFEKRGKKFENIISNLKQLKSSEDGNLLDIIKQAEDIGMINSDVKNDYLKGLKHVGNNNVCTDDRVEISDDFDPPFDDFAQLRIYPL